MILQFDFFRATACQIPPSAKGVNKISIACVEINTIIFHFFIRSLLASFIWQEFTHFDFLTPVFNLKSYGTLNTCIFFKWTTVGAWTHATRSLTWKHH